MIGIVMGSKSDLGIMRHAAETLESLGIPFEMRIISAHRRPSATMEWASSAKKRGLKVLIAGAGLSAHLPGVVAACTTLPVLGIPMPGKALGAADALYSIVQMPRGVPVGTLAIGRSGAVNAALLAAEIIALSDEELAKKIEAHREGLREAVSADDQSLQSALQGRGEDASFTDALRAGGFDV